MNQIISNENGRIFINAVIDGEVYHTVSLSADELNRLAMHAPMVKRMVEYIKCDYVGYSVDYPRACMRDNLLTDIKALEQPS